MGTPHRILVADDDPEILDEVARVLAESGSDVTRATTGDELVAHLADDRPYDLVVTDIAMPWMSGLQAMHASRYAGLRTPVVVMTALRDERVPDIVRALGERAVLLLKPFGIAELSNAIARVAGRGRA